MKFDEIKYKSDSNWIRKSEIKKKKITERPIDLKAKID